MGNPGRVSTSRAGVRKVVSLLVVVCPKMSVMMWVVVLVRMQSFPLGPMAMGAALAVVVAVV